MKKLRNDAVAGLTGAVAGMPQAMGFALIAGVNPVYGIYTAFAATIIAALTGRSTYMTVGPTNALSLVVASSLAGFDGAAEFERLFMLTFLVGVFMLLFGVLRLGFLVRFVSNAVMTGFITGAGLLIIFGQMGHLNGYEEATGANTTLRFFDWLLHFDQTHINTLVIGLLAMAIIYGMEYTRLRYVATLVAIMMTTVLVKLLEWDAVALVASISEVSSGLPMPVMPEISLAPELATAALAMAVLGSVQSAAITNSIPEPDGTPPNTSRDFIGMGLANLAGGVFQSMPACGSLSRTAVNIKSGARTRLANVFAGVFVAVFLLLAGGLIEQVTLAALAAHLFVAAVSLIRLDQIKLVWRVGWAPRAAMVATFLATLFLPLEYSIYVGVILSLALYLYTASENMQIERLIPTDDNRYRSVPVPAQLPNDDVVIVAIHGHLYFAAVKKLETLLPNPASGHGTVVILRMREHDHLGSTALRFLLRYGDTLRNNGGCLLLTGISPQMRRELERTGVIQAFGEDNLFDADEVYFSATTQAYEYAHKLLSIPD